jgi:general secretion pathway protein G
MRTKVGTQRRRGFTLIEIMVVVIILGILAATIIPQFVGVTQDAKQNKAKHDMGILRTSLETFFLQMDRYPTSEEGLKALLVQPSDGAGKWRGPYLQGDLPKDPWGHPYAYRFPGQRGPKTYDIWCRGADGVDGGEGVNADSTQWDQEAAR